MKECGCKECVEKKRIKSDRGVFILEILTALTIFISGYATGKGYSETGAFWGLVGGILTFVSFNYARMVGAKWGVEKL